MKQPLVSIITPSYNQGSFIRATIESVLSQDYQNIEYIIMDGGSKDETADIAKEYSDRLTFISERDRGQSHAINKGFQMARGEIVHWLNSDDTLLPGAVSHAVKGFEREPTLGAVYGEGYLIDRDGNIKSPFPGTESFNLWKLIYVSDYILQQTVFFRRAIFDEIGFINESLHWGMDWDLLIRIGKSYRIEYIPEYLGCLREYAEAKTFSGGRKRFRELVRIMRSHGTLRYPPAYFHYGYGTYQQLICNLLPFARLREPVIRATNYGISRVLTESQGLYYDGWAGACLHYMLSVGSGRVEIEGALPEWKELRQQTLEVQCNGSVIGRWNIEPGKFEIKFDLPKDTKLPVHIVVRASKKVRPSAIGVNEDHRRVAYMLHRIGWSA